MSQILVNGNLKTSGWMSILRKREYGRVDVQIISNGCNIRNDSTRDSCAFNLDAVRCHNAIDFSVIGGVNITFHNIPVFGGHMDPGS